MTPFNINKIRSEFPILSEKAYGKPLVYFDNAASSQKPKVVIDALVDYYSTTNANVHRGVHFLSQKASAAFDAVREKVKTFINASSEREIIFVRGTTEAINLVASTYGRKNIGQGDEILISAMEHHSNIVPWQMLCEEKGAVLKVIPMNEKGELMMNELPALLTEKTKFVSVVHISNSLGTINPVKEIIRQAHAKGIPVLVDGAQSTAHEIIDVQDLDADFFTFSGHKILGPTGVGCLYGKLHLLEAMPPYHGGGEMISSVSFEKTTYNEVPFKFEAGTPNIADVIALGTAIHYWNQLDRQAVSAWEKELLNYATKLISEIPAVRLIGTAENKASVVSFVIEGVNALDAGMFLDTKGIAVRTGHHCTEPVMQFFKIPGTLRASFMFYNTKEEIDSLVENLTKAIALLQPHSVA
ncbi:MAG: cysteine desulfurase [Bacteroidia bacterium]|nr:cysteine desulfurase [Bacteroidia bacterium]MBP7243983.1 cysteine desulfurase [Bacteroidia bacterium]